MDKIFPTQLVSEDGLRWINFFNGRLLTGDDLTQEQQVNRQAHGRLGQALGAGIINGLWVSANRLKQASAIGLTVRVDPGMAINRDGQVLWLKQAQTVSLLPPPAQADSTLPVSLFNDCRDNTQADDIIQPHLFNACGQKTQDIPVQNGIYLLALTPSEGREGRAPSSSLTGEGLAACNTKYWVEGVQFKLTPLGTSAYSELLRNQTAYACFTLDAPETVQGLDPFSQQSGSPRNAEAFNDLEIELPKYRLISDSCDVPLAVLYRDADGIHFVDNWSVRRRVTAATNASPWNLWLSDYQASEREAAFLQFQEQLASIIANEPALLAEMRASERFKMLPPVGVLPANRWRSFLGTHAPNQVTWVQADLLPGIVLQAFQQRPFQFEPPPPANPLTEERVLVALDVFQSHQSDFVVFARSTLGRLQIQFDSDPQNFAVTLQAQDTNLMSAYFAQLDGQPAIYQSVNLPAGRYHYDGGTSNLEFKMVAVDLVGGQILRKPVGQAAFSLPTGFWLDLETIPELKSSAEDEQARNFRLCLVAGATQEAFVQRNDPDRLLVLHEMTTVALSEEAQAQLTGWRDTLYKQLRLDEIRNLTPQLYIDPNYRIPPDYTSPKGARGASSIVEIPQVYLVLGTLLVPLSIINGVPPDRPTLSLRQMIADHGLDEFFRLHAPGSLSTKRLLLDLENFGILTVDQLAGSWIMMLAKITRLPDRDYRQLIWHTIQFFQAYQG